MENKKIKNKKVFIIILIVTVSLIVAFGAFGGTTYGLYKAEKKAVIILPGLFASGLYDAETGNPIWDPFEELELYYADIMPLEGDIDFQKILPLITEDVVKDQLSK